MESTRRLVTTWLENSRAAVLKKALEMHPDQTARPVWTKPSVGQTKSGMDSVIAWARGIHTGRVRGRVAESFNVPSPIHLEVPLEFFLIRSIHVKTTGLSCR